MLQSVMLVHGGEEVRCEVLAYTGAECLFGGTFNAIVKERTAGGSVRGVILLWDHVPGPFSYDVYEATNVGVTPLEWALVTNTTP